MPTCHFRIIAIAITILLLTFSAANYAVEEPLSQGPQSLPGGQTFGDWVVRCNSAEKPKVTCVMTQLAVVESSSERLMRINIAYQADFSAGPNEPTDEQSTIQITLPLGISLSKAPQIYIGGLLRKDAPIGLCLADGCYSTFTLDARLLEELLRMDKGTVRVQSGNGEFYELPVSGTGSRSAYNAMLTISQNLINE